MYGTQAQKEDLVLGSPELTKQRQESKAPRARIRFKRGRLGLNEVEVANRGHKVKMTTTWWQFLWSNMFGKGFLGSLKRAKSWGWGNQRRAGTGEMVTQSRRRVRLRVGREAILISKIGTFRVQWVKIICPQLWRLKLRENQDFTRLLGFKYLEENQGQSRFSPTPDILGSNPNSDKFICFSIA